MMGMKTEQMAMHAHIKNMEALLHSKHIAVPLMKNAPPESTPQQDDNEDGTQDMLTQIETLEAEEKVRTLDLSYKPGPLQNKLLASMQ